MLKQLDAEIYDFFLTQQADNTPHPVPVILDIDEESLRQYGQWPWSRYRLALLTSTLLEYGALSVALDIVLAESDRTSPVLMQEALRSELGVEMDFVNLPEGLLDNDLLFAENLVDRPIVLGAYLRAGEAGAFTEEEGALFNANVPSSVEFMSENGLPASTYLDKPTGVTMPLPVLANNSNLAFFNVDMDSDGVVRSSQLVASIGDRYFPSLSVKALMLALGQNNLRLNSGEHGLESIVIGPYAVPLSPNGKMNIPYQGPSRTFPYISAADLLNGEVDPADVQGRIVFIGTSAPGLLDIRATPLDKFFPGVEVHANIVDAIISQDFIITPNWTFELQMALFILNGIICTLIFANVRSIYSIVTMLALSSAYFFTSWYFFTQGYFVSPLWQILLVFLLTLFIMALRFWWEERDKRKLRNLFSRYVSPEVVNRIVEHGDIALTGEEREMTIMFTDLRGFTSISEKLLPQQIVSLLNSYFTPMTALVRDSEGTLDKFIGDAIMAFWNAPLDIENHPQKAVETAIKMLEELETINIRLKAEFGTELNMGAGIHTGLAYVGNMGSSDLTSYTVIGDSVNTASRLEGLCSKFGFRIILSGETAKQCVNNFIPLANLRVKGRKDPIEIFTTFSENEREKFSDELELYKKAYAIYKTCLEKKDSILLEESIKLFEELTEKFSYRNIYAEYLEYCIDLRTKEHAYWDGVWTLTSK